MTTMSMKRAVHALAALLIGHGLATSSAQAAIVIHVFQSGDDIQISAQGSLNTAGLVLTSQFFLPPAGIDPGAAYVRVGLNDFDRYSGLSGPTFFGDFANSAAWPTSGTPVGVFGNQGMVYLPTGYVSGAPLSGTGTISNANLAGALAVVGTYVWTLPSGNSDTITVIIGGSGPGGIGDGGGAPAVPEPASWAMLVAGFGLIGAVRRRRWQSPAVTA